MIEVNSRFDKDNLTAQYKKNGRLNAILCRFLSGLLFLCGVVNLIRNHDSGMEIFVSIVVMIASPMPAVYSYFSSKKFLAELIHNFGVEKQPMLMNFKFDKKEVIITITQESKSKENVILYENIYKYESKKDCDLIYLDKTRAFMLKADGYVCGNRNELKELMQKKNVYVKK